MKKSIILLFVLAAIAFSLHSCVLSIIDPAGEYVSKDYNVGTFEKISVSAGIELILSQDTTTAVRVETYENIFDYLIVKKVNNTLILTKNVEVLFKNPRIKVYVNVANLDEIVASSGSKVNFSSVWVAEDLNIEMSSGCSGMGNLSLNNLFLKLSSGSSAKYSGVVDNLTVVGSAGSSFRGLGLSVLDGSVCLSSASFAEVNASETLYAEGSGASVIRYKGTPEITVKTSSETSVIKLP
jgi:hypothetical protein